MIRQKVDSNNFDKEISVLLAEKQAKNIIRGRFYLEQVALEKKLDFIIKQFFSSQGIKSLTYKILYWEKDEVMISLMNSLDINNFLLKKSYGQTEVPGVLYIDMVVFEELIFRALLTNHFNFEIAKNPSLNLRVQICINKKNDFKVLDIYDDRGFDIYILERE